jgi:hypothetical protein
MKLLTLNCLWVLPSPRYAGRQFSKLRRVNCTERTANSASTYLPGLPDFPLLAVLIDWSAETYALAKQMLCFSRPGIQILNGVNTMPIPSFDLFKRDGSGRLIWLGVADDLKAAASRLKELASITPGEYLVFSQQSQKIVAMEAAK